MAPSSWEVISGKVFEFTWMLRVRNRISSKIPLRAILEVRNTTIHINFVDDGNR